MPVCAFYNLKGGVGKTTSAVNCAYLASRSIGPTLLCDLDPQGSASYYLRVESPEGYSAKKMLKGGKYLGKNIRESDYPNLYVLPSDFSFRTLDLKLDREKHRKRKLSEILAPLEKEFELIIIDSPPNITLESENIFRAADTLFIPLIPTVLSVESYKTIVAYLQKYDSLRLFAFFNLVDRRRKLHRDMVSDLPANFGEVFTSFIPYSSKVEQMSARRAPITAVAPRTSAAMAFVELWNDMKSVLFPDR